MNTTAQTIIDGVHAGNEHRVASLDGETSHLVSVRGVHFNGDDETTVTLQARRGEDFALVPRSFSILLVSDFAKRVIAGVDLPHADVEVA